MNTPKSELSSSIDVQCSVSAPSAGDGPVAGRDSTLSRQQSYDAALSAVRNRLGQKDVNFGELIDLFVQAVSNAGDLRGAHWYCFDGSKQFLQRRPIKVALSAETSEAETLSVADTPVLQFLLERPRVVPIHPKMREQLHTLLSEGGETSFDEHSLCASVFCGSVPLGVLYADAGGQPIGVSEAAKFKSIAQLMSKVATLFAMRNYPEEGKQDLAA